MRAYRWGLAAVAMVASVAASPSARGVAVDDGAAAIVGLPQARLLDTRASGPLAAGSEVAVGVSDGVPPEATGAYLNVTAVGAESAGHLTVYPCGEARPLTSSLNYLAGSAVASGVMVAIGADRQVCVATHATVHVIVDLTGYVPAGGDVRPLLPARVLDTRGGAHGTIDGEGSTGLVAGGTVTEVVVAGRAGVRADAGAAALTVTAIRPSGPGYVTAFACGTERPNVSSLNYSGGDVVASTVLTRLDSSGRVCLFTRADAHMIVDVVADAPGDAESITLTAPGRLLDTRTGTTNTTIDGLAQGIGRVPARHVVELQVADRHELSRRTSVVALTVTAVDPADAGHLTVYPCAGSPATSSLNFSANQTVANSVLVGVSLRGTVCIYSHAETDVVVDLWGFTETPYEYLHPLADVTPDAPAASVRSVDEQLHVVGNSPPPFKMWSGAFWHAIGGTGADEGRYVVFRRLALTSPYEPEPGSVMRPCMAALAVSGIALAPTTCA